MKRKLDKNKIKLFVGQAVLYTTVWGIWTSMLIYGLMRATTLN